MNHTKNIFFNYYFLHFIVGFSVKIFSLLNRPRGDLSDQFAQQQILFIVEKLFASVSINIIHTHISWSYPGSHS